MAATSLCQAQLVGRVSKPGIGLEGKHSSDSAPAANKTYSWPSAKRKRQDGESEERSDLTFALGPSIKKPKLSLHSRNRPILSTKCSGNSSISQKPTLTTQSGSTRHNPKLSLVVHNLSHPARTLITLHKFFLRALSIHYAHNGPHAPTGLGRLILTITKLWKERSVTQADVERMLAIYEVKTTEHPHGEEIPHCLSPFKLLAAGSCISLEYVGKRQSVEGPMSYLFDHKKVHDFYVAHIYALDSAWTKERHSHLSFLEEDSIGKFPRLGCDIGTQTAARQSHISQQRAEILTLSTAAQLRNTTTASSTADSKGEAISNAIAVIESRKQNLLDRIKAKQIASKTNAKPTHHQILRKHALGRIREVTDILRMMQQQQKGEIKSKSRNSEAWEIKSATPAGKVSFSLTQLRNNIKSSSRVPISDEEVNMCLSMLSEEIDGTWVKMIEGRGGSGAIFVVVEGDGPSGREVQSRLSERETL